MELDDLKTRWEACDRKLDASLRLTARLLNTPLLRKAETALTRLGRVLAIELALTAVVAIWLGWFNWSHITEPRFVIPGGMLYAGAIALVIAYVRQILALRAIDFASPIVGIQKQLERVRVMEIRATQWTLLLAPLVWTPLLIVGITGLLNVDAYTILNTRWLAANVLFGVVVVIIERWVSFRYAERMGRSPRLQRLMRDLTGYNLTAAMNFLRSASEFESEARETA